MSYPVTWITESLAVGYAPMSYAELDCIKASGIDAIVNLCAEFSDLHEIEKSSGFEVYYLPIWDEDIPEMEDMEKALEWLDESIYLGKKVLIHCRHGIGRTGTFVTSYMIRKGLTLKAASKKLKKFSKANPSNYGQWKLLKKYGKKTGALTIREPNLEVNNKVDLTLFFSDYESLIKKIDHEVTNHFSADHVQCGKEKDTGCCLESFNIQMIEVLYLHSKLNKCFTSDQRKILIEKAVETSRKEKALCPFNDGSGCLAYDIRPARCRIYGIHDFSSDIDEIQSMLLELSQTVFLAYSGRFLPDADFTFSISDTISGKFVQKYFNFIIGRIS
jgi:protein-tyrosine phosphatase/Fe-S-cluster containining protein